MGKLTYICTHERSYRHMDVFILVMIMYIMLAYPGIPTSVLFIVFTATAIGSVRALIYKKGGSTIVWMVVESQGVYIHIS